MIEQLTISPWQNTYQHNYHIKDVMRYLTPKFHTGGIVMDLGRPSPLSEKLKSVRPDLHIGNTYGDLDVIPFKAVNPCDYILYSHTIEHQFNPLFTLLEVRKIMHIASVMFIILPRRGKLLWDKGHYHEIDHYRMKLLLQRAGYEIISYELHKGWRPWWFYLTGIRPLLRLFFEFNAYYEVRLQR